MERRHGVYLFAAAMVMVCLAGPVSANGTMGAFAGVTLDCDEPVKGRKFDDESLSVLTAVPAGFEAESFVCSFSAKNLGSEGENNGQRGVKARASGTVFNTSGSPIGALNARIKTNAAGYDDFDLDPRLFSDFGGLAVDVDLIGSKRLNYASLECYASSVPRCQPDSTTACLGKDSRFQVEVEIGPGATPGQVFSASGSDATFFVGNIDFVVQLLDRCALNDHFWVFYGATTNVEFELTVVDTMTGMSRSYDSDLGRPSQPIQDTAAFATCP